MSDSTEDYQDDFEVYEEDFEVGILIASCVLQGPGTNLMH